MFKVFRLTVINELVPNDTYMHAYLISYLLSDPLSLNAENLINQTDWKLYGFSIRGPTDKMPP